jgi:putative endonuclease
MAQMLGMRILQRIRRWLVGGIFLFKKPRVGNTTGMWKQEDSSPHLASGSEGEDLAVEYLKREGFDIIDRNVRFPVGEIDIVAQLGEEIHFVEVKTRSSVFFAHPIESVTPAKQRRVRSAAAWFLARLTGSTGREPPCHFDVIGVDLSSHPPQIDWVRDAFE